MLRLLADENFNGDVVRGLLLRQEILLMDACTEQAEWGGRAVHVPL